MRNIFTIIILLMILFLFGCSFDKPTSSIPVTPSEPSEKTIPHSPSPTNGAVDRDLTVVLNWQSEDAAEYEIYIGEVDPPSLKYATTIFNTYTTPPLKHGIKYYWRVIAILKDGSRKAGPVWNFTTKQKSFNISDGYALLFNKLEKFLPNEVRVLFQVVDLNGTGVSNLGNDDFEVLENEIQISQSESELIIRRLPTIDYKIKTILLLDNSTSVETELTEIKNSARNIIAGIRSNQEFAIYQFSNDVILLQDYTSDLNLLNDAIENKFERGVSTTDFYGSVIKSSSFWKDSATVNGILQGCIVIISDGNDTRNSSSLAEALHSIRNKLVITVGLGVEIQPEILNSFGNNGYFLIGKIACPP